MEHVTIYLRNMPWPLLDSICFYACSSRLSVPGASTSRWTSWSKLCTISICGQIPCTLKIQISNDMGINMCRNLFLSQIKVYIHIKTSCSTVKIKGSNVWGMAVSTTTRTDRRSIAITTTSASSARVPGTIILNANTASRYIFALNWNFAVNWSLGQIVCFWYIGITTVRLHRRWPDKQPVLEGGWQT